MRRETFVPTQNGKIYHYLIYLYTQLLIYTITYIHNYLYTQLLIYTITYIHNHY